MKPIERKKLGAAMIAIGIAGVIHYKLMAIALIITGLVYIDNIYNQFVGWVRKTFDKGYDPDEGWIEIDKNGKTEPSNKKN